MKLRVYLSLSLALLGSPQLVFAQESGSSSSTVSGTPWVDNRALGEGIGIKTGSLEWHPGVSGEVGIDTNYLQRASSDEEEDQFGPPVSSMRFRVTPQLSVKTYDRSAEVGEAQNLPKPLVAFDAIGFASYNEFVSLKKEYAKDLSRLRNVQGGGSLGLTVLPQRPWSARFGAGYTYIAEPTNQGGFAAQYNRHLVNGGAALNWAPGGGAFRWTILGYQANVTLFDNREAFELYDRVMHSIASNGSWNFLPKTAALFRSRLDVIRYPGGEMNEGEALQAQLGLNGLLLQRLGFLATAGWATSFYHNRTGLVRNYNGPIGQFEAKWFLSSNGKLKKGDADVGASAIAIGYMRDYSVSFLADYYRRNRGYIKGSYLFAGSVVTTLEGGVSRLDYPDFMSSDGPKDSFGETRLDISSFTEYRPSQSVGINLQLRYDQNFSKVVEFADFTDDFSFNRFRAMLGARWFM